MSESPVSTQTPGPSPNEILLKTITALGAATGEVIDPASGFGDLLRAASKHCRRLVDAERVRIWVVRSLGRRLVAHEFGEGERPVVLRIGSSEGLAGWAIAHRAPLRLGPGDRRPDLHGETPSFRTALVIPLFRRGDVFGAIECLDKRGGGVFTPADAENLEVASEHIAFALDNALLVQETQRRALEKEV